MAQADIARNWNTNPESETAARGPAVGAGGGGIVSLIGGVASLALIVGLGVWGYRLAVRDVTGVPVVRALEGPMRIQPDDPGGEAAAHMGFSVNAVQAEGAAEPPAERLALAPRNIELSPEDQPQAQGGEIRALTDNAPAAPRPLSAANPPAQIAEAAPTPLDLDGSSEADLRALADQIAGDAAPLSGELTEIEETSADTMLAVDEAVEQVAHAPEIIARSVPGVAVSPRPGQRPGDFARIVNAAQAIAQPAEAPPGPTGLAPPKPALYVPEVPADQVPAGTRLVQLGAFDSEDVARAEWVKLAGRFEDYLEGKTRVIERATSGGRTFYRLRAMGFDDLAQARRFCAVLMAGKAACIPVVTR